MPTSCDVIAFRRRSRGPLVLSMLLLLLNLGVVEDLLENCTAADDLDLQMVVF